MINFTLFSKGIKESLKTFIIFALILTMYTLVIISLYDPEAMNALDEFKNVMPQLMDMVGMKGGDTSLLGFMSSYLYGFIMLVFPMVFSILTANKLIAKQVESGSMTYLLSAPVSRVKVAFTQMKVLLTGIFLMIVYITIIEIIGIKFYFPSDLELKKLLFLNAGLFGLHIFIGSICFISSAIFNETKYSIAFGAGIPAISYIIQMIANMGGNAENFKYATFFTLFSPEKIIEGSSEGYIGVAILAGTAFILYILSLIIFRKKDLSL